jgi:hypothetical protein
VKDVKDQLELAGTLAIAATLIGRIYGGEILFLIIAIFGGLVVTLVGYTLIAEKWKWFDNKWTLAGAAILYLVGVADIIAGAVMLLTYQTPK